MISLGAPRRPLISSNPLPLKLTVPLILQTIRLFRPESACHPAPNSSFLIPRSVHIYAISQALLPIPRTIRAQRTAAGSQF